MIGQVRRRPLGEPGNGRLGRQPVVVYLTGFRQHAGKTVTSLGIISQLRKHLDARDIGYLKPVGQQLVRAAAGVTVDKDVELIGEFAGLSDLPLAELSPVRFSSNFTRSYLDSRYRTRLTGALSLEIRRSVEKLADRRIIIAEGSGHPGVGSVVGLSNATVGKLLGAQTIFVSGGGIGRALDTIDVDLTYFLYHGCQVSGLIVNKVIPDKAAQVKRYITEDLINQRYAEANGAPLHIFGYMPAIPDLPHPSMRVILGSLPHVEPLGDPDTIAWRRPCAAIKLVSLPVQALQSQIRHYVGPGDVLIIGASSTPRILQIIDYHADILHRGGVGGLILTCGETEHLESGVRDGLIRANLPALFVREDSAATEERLFRLYQSTKLQVYDTGKIAEIERLFEDHFDTERFLDVFLS